MTGDALANAAAFSRLQSGALKRYAGSSGLSYDEMS